MQLLLPLFVALTCCANSPVPAGPAHSPTAIRQVVIRHGVMTYVMDSRAGQRDKARAAVASSRLVEVISKRGYRIELRFDDAAGDDVIVEADGRELGRGELHDIADGATPAPILDALR